MSNRSSRARPGVRCVDPSLQLLPAYAAALSAGWSPNSARDVSGEHLNAIAGDPATFIRCQAAPASSVREGPGGCACVLVRRIVWIWDGDFCGAANLRFVPGTTDLPPGIAGHVGFSIVPVKRGAGRGRAALAGLLDLARSAGLPQVSAVCVAGNLASRRVIEANRGRLVASSRPDLTEGQARYWIATARPCSP